MKLLLDENLSHRLVPFLQVEYPGTTQVVLIGLERASDLEIWQYAKVNDFVIVTRDADFEELSAILAHPPQVVWIKTRNQSRAAVLNLLISSRQSIEHALAGENLACIELRSRTL